MGDPTENIVDFLAEDHGLVQPRLGMLEAASGKISVFRAGFHLSVESCIRLRWYGSALAYRAGHAARLVRIRFIGDRHAPRPAMHPAGRHETPGHL